MPKTLEVRIRVSRKKLSPTASRALNHLDRYDWILFTSKNAVMFFAEEIAKRHISAPLTIRIAAVGPETHHSLRNMGLRVQVVPKGRTVLDMVKSMPPIDGSDILFPRSAIAPYDAVKLLRKKGAHVRVVPLYTTTIEPLSKSEKRALIAGQYKEISFRSPSGVRGLLRQLTTRERLQIYDVSVTCIGETTALAAKTAGFTKISIKSVQ